MSKNVKVDLSLLKKLVGELESSLSKSEELRGASPADNKEYIVELSKAAGLSGGVLQEASMLIMDIQSLVRNCQMPSAKGNPTDMLEQILGGLKGSGNGAN